MNRLRNCLRFTTNRFAITTRCRDRQQVCSLEWNSTVFIIHERANNAARAMLHASLPAPKIYCTRGHLHEECCTRSYLRRNKNVARAATCAAIKMLHAQLPALQ
jgi:hypothetical protein